MGNLFCCEVATTMGNLFCCEVASYDNGKFVVLVLLTYKVATVS